MTAAVLERPTGGALFAGYGGLERAVEQAIGPVAWQWYSDICRTPTDDNPATHYTPHRSPCRILAHHYPNIPNLGDISAIDWSMLGEIDILTGGFPCQDLSHAGKRLGLRPDTRSGLWSQMAYAIAQLRPRLVVAENVRGLLSSAAHSDVEPCPWCMGDLSEQSALRALGAVLGDLAELGYDAQWVSIRAADVGAPHGRFRVFLTAHPAGEPWEFGDGDDVRVGWEQDGRREAAGGRGATRLDLLPTPEAKIGDAGPDYARAGRDGSGGDDLVTAVHRLENEVAEHLLPTPNASLIGPHGERGARTLEARDGKQVELPDVIDALLPTPVVTDAMDSRRKNEDGTPNSPNSHPGTSLSDALNGLPVDEDDLTLFPTPRGSDAAKGSPNQHGSSGDLMLTSAVHQLLPTPSKADGDGGHTTRSGDRIGEPLLGGIADLLPTPTSRDHKGQNQRGDDTCLTGALLPTPNPFHMTSGDNVTPEEWMNRRAEVQERTGTRHGPALPVVAQSVVEGHPLVQVGDGPVLTTPPPGDRWGVYGPAVRRWETITGVAAPSPTEPGKAGKQRLSPAFVEWMMGLQAGWVTDVPGATRAEQLKALGNGVVPAQAAAAIRYLLTIAYQEVHR